MFGLRPKLPTNDNKAFPRQPTSNFATQQENKYEPLVKTINIVPQQEEIKKSSVEFEDMVKTRLSKIDEFMLAMKENQYKKEEPVPIGVPIKIESFAPEKVTSEQKIIPEKKQRGFKKTYLPISDMMWDGILQQFPEIPKEYRDRTFSDGNDYFIDTNKKKNVLDGKEYLKIINKIKK
jgi:hypothetical protein